MSTAAEPAVGEHRFVIRNVGWQGYQTLLTLFEENGPRITYDRGTVEFMSPSIQHERPKKLLDRIIQMITEELDIAVVGAGSTTFNSEILDRGIEPDDCYHLANAHRLRKYPKVYRMDLAVDPVPDLAIEVEITASMLDKLGIYAALQIPEIWRHDGESLQILLLGNNGKYLESETSASFPFVPIDDVRRLLGEDDGTNDTRWGRSVRAWVRETVLPRYRGA